MKQLVIDYKLGITNDFRPETGQTLDDYLNQVKSNVETIKRNLPPNVINHEISIEPFGYDGYYEVDLLLYREETDEEYEARLQQEKDAQEAAVLKQAEKIMKQRVKEIGQEQLERLLLAQLKAKYE